MGNPAAKIKKPAKRAKLLRRRTTEHNNKNNNYKNNNYKNNIKIG